MGTLDHHYFGQKDLDLRTCAGILIVASPGSTAGLDASAGGGSFPGMVIHSCDNGDPVPADAAAMASIVVVEVDPARRESMARLAELKQRHPHLPVIAALADVSVALTRTLVREGIDDVVSLPFNLDELLETALEVLATSRRSDEAQVTLAPLVAVVRSIGGCGATSIATHLAADLAQHDASGRGVAIVDLDLQCGSVSHCLGGAGSTPITDLIEEDQRLDAELLRSAAHITSDNISVFSAPNEILPLETIDTDKLLRTLNLLRRHYGAVVLDLPANWTNWTLSAVSNADQVVMVVELTVASLRQAKRRLEFFDSVGIERANIGVVVNRVEKKLFRSIDLSDVEHTLGRPVTGSIALEDGVNSAQDQGLLVQHVNRKSKFHADVARLGESLRSRMPNGNWS